jgi:Flp pilus assembly protein protease CpaA
LGNGADVLGRPYIHETKVHDIEFGCAMNPDLVLLSVALVLAAAAAAFDVQQRRIPNWLTFPGIVLGVVLRGMLLGCKGAAGALAGCLLAGGIFLLFYAVRAMGAGDVKLAGAIGSLLGSGDAAALLLATAICGGVLAIAHAVFRHRICATVMNLARCCDSTPGPVCTFTPI